MLSLFFSFFFFQAEDGIRDATVTGVQTCALPIYVLRARRHGVGGEPERASGQDHRDTGRRDCAATARGLRRRAARSEERRVGKECRSRWSRYHDKKNSIET